MPERTAVSIARCDSYEKKAVKEALSEALAHIGGLSIYIAPKDRVLIKPNLVRGANPESAISPHPEVLRALIEMLQELGADVSVGDSPGMESPEQALEASGYMEIMREYGVKVADFYREVEVPVPNGGFSKKVKVVRAIIEADKIINFAKMKTHGFMMFSGCVKNMFGVVSGVSKIHSHIRFPNPDLFAQGLLDIFTTAKPTLNIMDAVIAMEGDGPTNGSPKKVGILLASPDGVALDVIASAVIGIDPSSLATTAVAQRRGAGITDLSLIDVLGCGISEVAVADFEFPKSWRGITSKFAKSRFMRSIGSVRPKVIHRTCKKCQRCIKGCPANAMRMVKGRVIINHSMCIKCYCCQEHCPYDSIKLKAPLFAKLLFSLSQARELKHKRIENDWR